LRSCRTAPPNSRRNTRTASPSGLVTLVVATAAALSSCVKEYQPPREGENAALIKLKLGYDDAKARGLLDPSRHNEAVKVWLHLRDGEDRYLALSKTYPSAFAVAEPAVLDIQALRIHAGRPVTLEVRLSVIWQTQEWEWVTQEFRRPVAVRRTERVYDPGSKRYETRIVTGTEHVTEFRRERELVTRDHERGCTAAAALDPAKDEIYLLDYTNPEIVADCTVQAYRQVLAGDGTFRLEPVATGFVQ
jgi:hypothetical protein